MTIRYARGRDKFDAHPIIREAADFGAFERAVLADRARAKGLQYVCAPFRGNGDGRAHRGKNEAEPRRFHPLDFDFIADADTSVEVRMRMAAYRGFGYTTASHKPDAPRCRMVLELDRAVDRIEGMRLGRAIERDLYAEFGERIRLDATVYRGEQPCFGPLVHSETFRLDGDPLDVDRWLATAPEAEAERKGSAAIEPGDDPVIVTLKARGMYRRDLGAGRHAIRCPWGSAHTSEDPDTSTATCYMQPHHAGFVTAGFRCQHDHCTGRKGDDLLAFLGVDWRAVRDAYSGHAPRAGGDPEIPPHIEDGAPAEGATQRTAAPERPMPANILRQVSAPAFEFEDVPKPLAKLARAWSDATGFDRSGIIVAGVIAAAAAIDDRYRLTVRAKSQWYESARLWGVLLVGPSGGKSPILRAAADPIKAIHGDLFRTWERDGATLKEDERPPCPALYTSDATVEAMSETLRGNPRGLVFLTEEFGTFIGQLDAYKNGAGGKDRAEWLQLYDGGPHQIDRIKRGRVFVPNWGASVLAAGTPDGLKKQMKDMPEDGLIHRFIPCVMGPPGDDGNGDATEALKAWEIRIREIFQRTTCEETHIRARFAFDAQPIFDEEVASLRRIVGALYEQAPALAAHLGKHAGMLARVSLTFHVLDARPSDAIEVDTVRLAIRFMRRVRRHANAMFSGILGAAPAYELARALGRSIVADDTRPATVGRDYMTQHCRAFRAASTHERRSAIEFLEDAGWITPYAERTYGGLPSAWAVDGRVFDLFAAEGEKHRERRAAVREAFGA